MTLSSLRAPGAAIRARHAQQGSGPSTRRGWQIGPRIRIGGTLGKIGQNVKIGAGKVLSNKLVDTGLSLIPGVGPGVAAAANATGHVLDTSNGGIHSLGDVANVAKDAGETYGMSKLAGAGLGKLKSIAGIGQSAFGGGAAGGAAGGGAGGVADPSGAAGGADGAGGDVGSGGDIAGAQGQDGGGWLDELKKLGSGAVGGLEGVVGAGAKLFGGGDGTGGMSAADLAKMGLLGGSVAAAAQDRTRQQGLQDKAISYATGDYDKNAGLRDQARAMLAKNGAPDLSSVFSDPGNVYSRANRVPVNPPAAQ